MAVVLLALVATVEEVAAAAEGSSATPANGCGRNNGTWTSCPSSRRTSTSSTPTWPAGLWYVLHWWSLTGVAQQPVQKMCCTCFCSYAIMNFICVSFFLQQEAEQYRRAKTITYKGRDCPNPILKFHEASFPCEF